MKLTHDSLNERKQLRKTVSIHVSAHLMAVFNQLAHRCGNLTDSVLELQGSNILIYFCVLCIQVCLVFCKSLCVLFCKKCEQTYCSWWSKCGRCFDLSCVLYLHLAYSLR